MKIVRNKMNFRGSVIFWFLVLLVFGIVINSGAETTFEDSFTGTKIDWLKWDIAPKEYDISQNVTV